MESTANSEENNTIKNYAQQLLKQINEEVDRQNEVVTKIKTTLNSIVLKEGNQFEEEYLYHAFLAEYNALQSDIKASIDRQENLKAKLAKMKKSDHQVVDEFAIYNQLQRTIYKHHRRLNRKINKMASKKKVTEYQEKKKLLEEEKRKNFELKSFKDQLKSEQIRNCELKSIYDQKVKRNENLTEMHRNGIDRIEKLKTSKDELLKKLKELQMSSKNSSDEETDSD